MNRKAISSGVFLLVLLLSSSLSSNQLLWAQDAPSAGDDAYNVREDSSLSVTAPGLYFNDNLPTDSLFLILVDPPANGEVTIAQDGSFSYVPDLGFDGTDSFSYMLKTLPKQELAVDSTRSSLNFDMEVSLPIGTDDDNITVSIGGMTSMFLQPDNEPFEQAQLYEMDLVVTDSIDLAFRFGGLITLGRLFVDATPGAFNLNLSERGAPSGVTDGLFTQEANKISVIGTVNLEGTGLIAGEIPDDPQDFDTETETDITIQTAVADTLLTAELPVSLEEEFDLSGTEVLLKVDGTLFASGKLKPSLESNVATVSITVEPLIRADVDRELPFQYALSQNFPNPFNPVTTIEYSIPTAEQVTLRVFNMLGREVATLVEGIQAPGIHEVQFNAGNLPSGMYVYRLEASGFNETKKLVLLK
ncbi:MAG: Ig-like domain-containing protein [Bacteroidota bacterium]